MNSLKKDDAIKNGRIQFYLVQVFISQDGYNCKSHKAVHANSKIDTLQ